MLKQFVANALNSFVSNIVWLCDTFKEDDFKEMTGIKEFNGVRVTVKITKEVLNGKEEKTIE